MDQQVFIFGQIVWVYSYVQVILDHQTCFSPPVCDYHRTNILACNRKRLVTFHRRFLGEQHLGRVQEEPRARSQESSLQDQLQMNNLILLWIDCWIIPRWTILRTLRTQQRLVALPLVVSKRIESWGHMVQWQPTLGKQAISRQNRQVNPQSQSICWSWTNFARIRFLQIWLLRRATCKGRSKICSSYWWL